MRAAMPVGEHVVARAREHIAAGTLSAAHDLLSAALGTVPTDPAQATPVVAEAVVLETGVLLGLGEPYAARGWAAYGFAASRALYGERDRRTLHALGLLAAVLARVGVHARAVQRYLDLIAAYSELDGPDSDRVLAARGDLATVEHAQGHCVTARLRLATVIDEHRRAHGAAHPVGIRMQLRLAAMWRDCGGFNDAHELLAEAREYAAGLDPADPVHAMITAAGRAVADPRHRCGVGLIPDAPISPVELAGGAARQSPAPLPDPVPQQRAAPADAWAQPEQEEQASALWDHLTPAGYEPPSVLAAPTFSTTVYLPPYLNEPAVEPAAPERAGRQAAAPAARRLPQHTLVLVAACVGIVAVALLFVLLVSSVSP
ncbi:hypothetical protein Cch02nite_73010 [Catellatospora chokoriensis]|uniref:Tetratricopeptide repeat protein n=2 Tax=Catellatospora chokoriensis TaxID=310353 RepID=A0A8J3JZC3_9ACTN|nr:hypothetical protein Cch02nite_73010 [Catellatospora chokoriensis]